ncbi:hypothetical protein [Flavobacterium difficile]|uniref:Uncharacterized protein n=1 Tax=Flavobacterium difficile TaxID=2709659 RepID=A0ABX0I3L4_9FLAO|nr:hypothetical protein [Flavobacterium difficile]NHM01762.1 hypothetical protein [Flavobacterium difficile]
MAYIVIDMLLSKLTQKDEKHPLKVFIPLKGDCNGAETEITINGFKVKELDNGKSNVFFSWNLVAYRANVIDVNRKIQSKHVDIRFTIGPNQLNPEKQTDAKHETDERKLK